MIPLRYQVGLTASLTLRLNALAELGLIDEYEFVVQPQAGGPRADVVRGTIEACRLEAREPAGVRLGDSGDAVRAEKVAIGLASPSRPHHEALVRGSCAPHRSGSLTTHH